MFGIAINISDEDKLNSVNNRCNGSLIEDSLKILLVIQAACPWFFMAKSCQDGGPNIYKQLVVDFKLRKTG